MSAIGDAVSALCASMGLQPGGLPTEGHVAIEVEDLGELHLETTAEALLVYLRRRIDVGDDRRALQLAALDAVHWRHAEPFPVQAAATDDGLVFLCRFDGDRVDLPALESAVALLGRMQDAARA
ncbi:MAG: hypothetical protein AAF968_02230 [Pseudomonadota bacterium]